MLNATSERPTASATKLLGTRNAASVGRRMCAAMDCDRRARPRGRLCEKCHKKAWRAANKEYAASVESSRTFSPAAQQLRLARATILMDIKAGRVIPQPCQVCGAKGLVHHPDPSKMREIMWFCRYHRLIQRELESEARRTEDERRAADARKAAWSALSTRFAEAWPLLPASHQQQIQDLARQNPLIRQLHPEAPLVRQALIRAYGVWCDSG